MNQNSQFLSEVKEAPSKYIKNNQLIQQDLFVEWNYRILHSFFNLSSKGLEVFLRIDRYFLDQIGQDIGGDAGFINAVKRGPYWCRSNSDFVKNAIKTRKLRKNGSIYYKDPGQIDNTYKDSHAPAYLPYLAALVRNSAELNKGYYESIVKDFDLGENFKSSEMAMLENVWEDLENWTKECNGEFGWFHVRRLGGYERIGVPLSQCIVKPADLERLPVVLARAKISPGKVLTPNEIARVITEAKDNQEFLQGFHQALNDPDFFDPIKEIICSFYEDWDGSIPIKTSENHNKNLREEALNNGNSTLSLALVVETKNPLSVSPRWHTPKLKDSGNFELSLNQMTWSGRFSGTDGACTENDDRLVEQLWFIAGQNNQQAPKFNITLNNLDDSETDGIEINLDNRLLWIFTPRKNIFTGKYELLEGILPATGVAYLLAPPNNVSALKHYIDQQRSGKIIEVEGIPKDWLLARLSDCSVLTEEQRLLPDGRLQSHPKPHPIRFTGGRSIRRGYRRMYLPYDLPTIELDAPNGTKITCSNELIISPQVQDLEPDIDNDLKSRYRFDIELPSSNSALYELNAIDKSGNLLGTARLRVSGLDGGEIEVEDFSLDSIGRPQNSFDGLSGSYLPNQFRNIDIKSCETISINTHELGKKVEYSERKASIQQKFLDKLANSNSLSFGSARDFLERQIQVNDLELQPVFVLLELRRLGHLELSTSQKGHIKRVHAIKPRLYKLPLIHAGEDIYGISGTLKLKHWEALSANDKSFRAYSSHNSSDMMTSFRLLVSDIKKTKNQFWQFEFIETSALDVANWAAGIQRVKEQIEQNTMESIGSPAESALKFNASMGVFRKECNFETWQLWKVQDLDTRIDQIYVLANKSSSSSCSEYAFVRDSSWGKWIATSEFVRWISNKYEIEDLHSVPINYNCSNGTFWIPARIGLPVILERALVMCNGTSPEIITLQRSEQSSTDNRISLSRFTGQSPVLEANKFYTDMAEGKWLSFHNVPEQVAQVVASKLGAVLDIF